MRKPAPEILRALAAYRRRGGAQSIQVPTKPLSETGFQKWLTHAEPGEALQYHVGLLLQDRFASGPRGPNAESRSIDRLAHHAWEARQHGLLHLFSQGQGQGRYRYLGIRSCRPWPSPEVPIGTPPWVTSMSTPAIH